MEVLSYQLPLWQAVLICLSYYVFISAVGAMEAPKNGESRSYRFWFKFLNQLAGNFKRAALALKVPTAEDKQP